MSIDLNNPTPRYLANQAAKQELYNNLYDEYLEVIEDAFRKRAMLRTPAWETFVKEKTGRPSSGINAYATAERPIPTNVLQDRKIDLAGVLIKEQNAKLDGYYQGGKSRAGGASYLFQNVIIGKGNRLSNKPGLEKRLNDLVKSTLDTKEEKTIKAFNAIVNNPEYKLKTSVKQEIRNLMGESKDFFKPSSQKGIFAKLYKDLVKDYNYTDPKTGKVVNDIDYIGRIAPQLSKGSNSSVGYLLELAEDARTGRSSFVDWYNTAGDEPHQWTFRQMLRTWNQTKGQGAVQLYDINGNLIPYKGQKINTKNVLFSYNDPELPQYQNKLYSFNQLNEKQIAKINKKVSGDVIGLRGQMKKLPEWSEVVEVVDGKNKLFNTKTFNPFVGKETTYRQLYNDTYGNVDSTAYQTSRRGYSKLNAMAAHIDHDQTGGSAKKPFNNLRIATGQQNHMFKAIGDYATKNPDAVPFVRALESQVYPIGSSIDDQIKFIVNQTKNLSDVVSKSSGRVTIPTTTEIAAQGFLSDDIPDVPESLKTYLKPKAEVAQGIFKDSPKIASLFFNNARSDAVAGGQICELPMIKGKASGGSALKCVDAVEDAIQNNPQKLAQEASKIGKFKQAATGFLGFLKGPGPKTFGIGAGVGAAIGLVKAFRNDDPTSYLSNEDQQKNMLVDMATQPVSLDIERPAILDYQLPALGASVAGSTALAAPSTIKASKSRALGIERKPKGVVKTGLRVLGRGLGIAASPALLAPFAVGDIASQIAEGDTPEDIATNPLNYLYPAFADQTPKLTRGLSPTLRKVASLGLKGPALRLLSRAGIGGFAASSAIQGLGLLDD
jgi:hypothetical protein